MLDSSSRIRTDWSATHTCMLTRHETLDVYGGVIMSTFTSVEDYAQASDSLSLP